MQQTLGGETIEPVERLLSELRAIERWDTEYWRKSRPEWHEKGAFVSRQKDAVKSFVNCYAPPRQRGRYDPGSFSIL